MSHNPDTESLMAALREDYSRLNDSGDIAISPALLAARTLERIDPDGASPHLVGLAASLELRQLARSVCRRKCDDEAAKIESGQGDFFELQPRYPAVRNGDECYVLRMSLTLSERRANINRLRSESAAKMRHARALEAETDRLMVTGHFGSDPDGEAAA